MGLNLDVGLKFDVELKPRAIFGRLRLSTTESMTDEEVVVVERAVVNNGILVDDEENGKDVDSALLGVFSRENKLTGATSGQQDWLDVGSLEPVLSQHIQPTAHSSPQLHTVAPWFLKSTASSPVYLSVFQRDRPLAFFLSIDRKSIEKK